MGAGKGMDETVNRKETWKSSKNGEDWIVGQVGNCNLLQVSTISKATS